MPEPGSPCLACGAPTRLRYPARRKLSQIPPDELRCTSDYLGQYDEIWHCPGCGLGYQALACPPHELVEGYTEVVDPLYLAEEEQRRAEFRELLGRLARVRPPPGRLLEVGSFAGLCLDEARALGWDPVGVEPSKWACEHARTTLGVEVVEGTLADAPWPPGTFDAVVAWDVLEHLPDPLGDLHRIHGLLKPGGYAALTTINIAGWAARLLRSRWPWLMHMHLWYFTPQALRLLLTKAGFEEVRVEPHPKRLRLGYVLKRAERYSGRVGQAARRLSERTGLAGRVVRIDFGDIVLVLGRKAS